MADYNAPSCVAQVGLLVLHKCGRRAAGRCDGCGLPFCRRHLVEVEGGGRLCPSCVERQGASPRNASEAVERHRQRSAYYRDYDYYPYFWSDRYYLWDDYDVVERQEAAAREEGADADDYDFTES